MNETLKKFTGWVIVVLSICFILWVFFVTESFFGVLFGTFILVLGIVMIDGSSDAKYNSKLTSIKRISDTKNITFEKMYKDFKDLDTPLGTPWIGRAAWNVKESMVYGPFKDNDLIYVYLKRGKCYISSTGMEDLRVSSPEVQAHKVTVDESALTRNQIACFHLMNNLSVAQMHQVMKKYFETGVALWSNTVSWKDVKAYGFTEEFKLTGQEFKMTDMDNNEIVRVSGTYPLKTISFYDSKTSEEIFKVEKKLLHVLPHYEFYEKGNLIGQFEQNLDITRDTFKMESDYGTFNLVQNLDNFGAGYTVYLNGEMIGAVAKRLNLSMHNLVFDNFVFWTVNDRYRMIIAAFAVMIAREMVRDRDGIA